MWRKATTTSLLEVICIIVLLSLRNHHKVHLTIERVISAAEKEKMLNYVNHYIDPDTIVYQFENSEGEWIDCVDMYRQPSLKSPLLKGHKIQSPPSEPKGEKSIIETSEQNEIWAVQNIKEICPKGSIPILRPTIEQFQRFETLKDVFKKIPNHLKESTRNEFTPPNLGSTDLHQYAHASQSVSNWGVEAVFNYWDGNEAYVERDDEFTLSQTWVVGGSGSGLQTLEAGWNVYRDLYNGSNKGRLFIYWTSDNYQNTGCYNLLCSGFVQTDNSVVIGGGFNEYSQAGGTQTTFKIRIQKSSITADWWLRYEGGGTNVWVGYWPRSLFNSSGLANQASVLDFGGEIIDANTTRHTHTDMGSGYWPSDGFGYSAYTRNILGIDTNFAWMNVNLTRRVTDANCYDLNLYHTTTSWGTYFYFGGPGYNINCQ